MRKLRIALLLGGFSAEREISIKTGKKIAQNLDKNKYQVFLFDPKRDLLKFILAVKKKKIDLVFPALHGPFGEDGTIQGMLELFSLPYVFSGVLASSLAMNKEMSKKILEREKIPTSPYLIINDRSSLENKISLAINKIKLPFVVKPVNQGSSIGITIVREKEKVKEAFEKAFDYDSKILIEKFINGREITCAVLGNKKPTALPLIEIRPKISHFFDYQAKYLPGGSEEICPAPVSKLLTRKIQETAIKTHLAFGCRGVTRTDMILKNQRPYVLEINTIPGMTEISLVPQAAAKAGLSFPKLLDKLIELALER